MTDEKIARINALYHKSKTPQGLNEEEKAEQAALRKEYLASIRKNMRSQLNQITVVSPDGSRKELKKLDPDAKHRS